MTQRFCLLIALSFALAVLPSCSQSFKCHLNESYCSGQPQSGEANIAGAGESCQSASCEAGYYCTEAKTCAATKPQGASCSSSFECDHNCSNGVCQ